MSAEELVNGALESLKAGMQALFGGNPMTFVAHQMEIGKRLVELKELLNQNKEE